MTNEMEELIQYRISRAHETLSESLAMYNAEFYNGSVNRTYYACYYAVSALLLKHKIITQSHKGVRQQFGQQFVQKGIISKEMGRYFSDLFDRRHASDYDDFITCDKATAELLLTKANEFIEVIEDIL